MRAIVIERPGGREELRLRAAPTPTVGPDDVLVRARAAGVGMWDAKVRENPKAARQYPFTLGWEGAGVVERVGARVSSFVAGDAVCYYAPQAGTYAELVAAPAALVARKPESTDFLHAAGLPVNGITAHQALTEDLPVRAGETILVAAAAGGVGTFAVQLAAGAGANVIGTASARNDDYVRSLGAREVIDYRTQDVVAVVRAAHPAGVDAALVCVDGDTAAHTIDAVRDGGRLAWVAEVSPVKPARGIALQGIYGRPDGRRLATVAGLVDAGRLAVHVDAVFPLREAARAHPLVEAGHVRGKVVLEIGDHG